MKKNDSARLFNFVTKYRDFMMSIQPNIVLFILFIRGILPGVSKK